MRKMTAAAGSAAFFVLAPGVVAGLVPWWLTGWRTGSPYPVPVRITGGVLAAAGAVVLIYAFAQFAIDGRGTPAPPAPTERLAVLAVLAAVWLVYEHREGFVFAATTVTIAACIVSIFVELYPNVMVSSTSKAYNLTVHNTASGGYSLKVMTVVVIILLPVVLAYQTWTYYVFRRRISRQEFQPPAPSPGATPEPEPTPPPAAPSAGPGS